MAGKLWAFYRLNGDLYLRVVGWKWSRFRFVGRVWRLDDVTLQWSAAGRRSRLAVVDAAGGKVQFKYWVIWSIKDDPTPFVDDEDFDFGLFIFQILNDPARKACIYTAERT